MNVPYSHILVPVSEDATYIREEIYIVSPFLPPYKLLGSVDDGDNTYEYTRQLVWLDQIQTRCALAEQVPK